MPDITRRRAFGKLLSGLAGAIGLTFAATANVPKRRKFEVGDVVRSAKGKVWTVHGINPSRHPSDYWVEVARFEGSELIIKWLPSCIFKLA